MNSSFGINHTELNQDSKSLEKFLPRAEIIWGDEDNDHDLYLNCINKSNNTKCQYNVSQFSNSPAIIEKGIRIQISPIWHERYNNFSNLDTSIITSVSSINCNSKAVSYNDENNIVLKRSTVFPERNFILDVPLGCYLLKVDITLSQQLVTASYIAKLNIVDSQKGQ